MYLLKRWVPKKIHEQKIHVAEMGMLSRVIEVTRQVKSRN